MSNLNRNAIDAYRAIEATLDGIDRDPKSGTRGPSKATRVAAERVARLAASANDPELSGLAASWTTRFHAVEREWSLPTDAARDREALKRDGGAIALRLAQVLDAVTDSETEVIDSFPLAELSVSAGPLRTASGTLELTRYRSLLLWRIRARLPEMPLGALRPGQVVDVGAVGRGDAIVSGRAWIRSAPTEEHPEQTLVLEGLPRGRIQFQGEARRHQVRRSLPAVALVSFIAVGTVASAFVGWQFRALLQATIAVVFAVASLGWAIFAIRLALGRVSNPARLFPRRALTRRFPWLVALGSVAISGVLTTLVVPPVADWLHPPDRLDVTIERVYHGARGSEDVYVSGRRTPYSPPLFIQVAASAGPATIFVGHVSRALLCVAQPPAASCPARTNVGEAAVLPAQIPPSLPSTPIFDQALSTPRPGAVFGDPAPITFYWYRSDGVASLVVAGWDTTETPICLLTSLVVADKFTSESDIAAGDGGCGVGSTAPAGEVQCSGSESWTFEVSTIPIGRPGILFVEIRDANRRTLGFSQVSTTGSELPELDPRSVHCG